MMALDAPRAVRWICRTLEEAGFETWAVGGAVRDALAGRPSGDWDLTTRARPGQVRRHFPRTVPIGIEHGTVGVLTREGTLYEVTTFRRDVATTGRHAVVSFADTLDEDLARRDFTINAVAWHPLRRVIHDPYGGARDLEAGILRTVGDPWERFREDYLRVLRALRFAGTFRLEIEAGSWRALVGAVPRMGILSPERVREELEKILTGDPPPSRALSLYAASGALAFLYPELDALVGRAAPGRPGDRWSHALRTVDLLRSHRAELRWIALLAGVGPEGEAARRTVEAALLLKRIRSSNARIDRVASTVEWVREPPAPDATDADLRRWLSEAGRERLPDVLRTWAAEVRADEARRGNEANGDGGGRDREEPGPGPDAVPGGWRREGFLRLTRRLRAVARGGDPLSVEELAFSGRDLIRMGYRPGPHFGELLRHLLDRALENPARNVPEVLAEEAERWMDEREAEAPDETTDARGDR
jgi:tRNA nucleotidyltransferase (CCA-adding enzyme)